MQVFLKHLSLGRAVTVKVTESARKQILRDFSTDTKSH